MTRWAASAYLRSCIDVAFTRHDACTALQPPCFFTDAIHAWIAVPRMAGTVDTEGLRRQIDGCAREASKSRMDKSASDSAAE